MMSSDGASTVAISIPSSRESIWSEVLTVLKVSPMLFAMSLPPQVLALKGRAAFCLKSGKKYQLSEAERIILKPV